MDNSDKQRRRKSDRKEANKPKARRNIRSPDEYVLVKDRLPLALTVIRRGIVYDL